MMKRIKKWVVVDLKSLERRSTLVRSVEESVTRFGIYKCTFDLCTYQEKEILFL